MTDHSILPWHTQTWQMLWDAARKNRLPHALLFLGMCDIEKNRFADRLAHALLCVKPSHEGKPCEVCHACHLVKAQSHPDLMRVEPEETGQILKIDQIREVVSKVTETAMQGGLRIVILYPAQMMNVAAANALLKTLEEPAPNTLLILIADQALRLPATIASRCQKIMFHKPAKDIATAWLQSQQVQDTELLLKIAEGFPLKALSLATDDYIGLRVEFYRGLQGVAKGSVDPLMFAVQCQEKNTLVLLMLLQSWLRDLLRIQLAGESELINHDYQKAISDVAQVISLENSIKYLELVQSFSIKILNRFNLNKQLLFEELWITWKKYVSS